MSSDGEPSWLNDDEDSPAKETTTKKDEEATKDEKESKTAEESTTKPVEQSPAPAQPETQPSTREEDAKDESQPAKPTPANNDEQDDKKDPSTPLRSRSSSSSSSRSSGRRRRLSSSSSSSSSSPRQAARTPLSSRSSSARSRRSSAPPTPRRDEEEEKTTTVANENETAETQNDKPATETPHRSRSSSRASSASQSPIRKQPSTSSHGSTTPTDTSSGSDSEEEVDEPKPTTTASQQQNAPTSPPPKKKEESEEDIRLPTREEEPLFIANSIVFGSMPCFAAVFPEYREKRDNDFSSSSDDDDGEEAEGEEEKKKKESKVDKARRIMAMEVSHPDDADLAGSVVFLAAYFSRKGMLKRMATWKKPMAATEEEEAEPAAAAEDDSDSTSSKASTAQPDTDEQKNKEKDQRDDTFINLATDAVFQLALFQRYSSVMALLNVAPELIHRESPQHKTLLHMACLRRKPNPEFIAQILEHATFDDVVKQDDMGMTPLHYIARDSFGREGRDVALLLMKKGADPHDADVGCDYSAIDICANPAVREVLGSASSSTPKKINRLRMKHALDSSVQREIDDCADVSKLPPLKPIDESKISTKSSTKKHQHPPPSRAGTPSLVNTTSSSRRAAGRDKSKTPTPKVKKVDQEQLDAMLKRLNEDAPGRKKRWMEEQIEKLEAKAAERSRKFTTEEQSEVTDRMYMEGVERQQAKKEEARAKYMREPTEEEKEKGQRAPNEIEESVNRLFKGSIEKKLQTTKVLEEKYAPSYEDRQLSKEEQEAANGRLHSDWAKLHSAGAKKLYEKYLNKDKSRFAGGNGKKMTAEDWRKMGERLVAKK